MRSIIDNAPNFTFILCFVLIVSCIALYVTNYCNYVGQMYIVILNFNKCIVSNIGIECK